MIKKIIIIVLFLNETFASGAFDHGTSTGKNLFEIDLTWNPFNYFKNGQSYVVVGYGITNKIDFHGYYSIHQENFSTLYNGLFFQFYESNKLDLATAVGIRKNLKTNYSNIFFPQLLFNIKLHNQINIGGSFVNILGHKKININSIPIASDIGIYFPIHNFFKKNKMIKEVKVCLSLFNPVTNTLVEKNKFIPTYSVDIKFEKLNF